MRGGFGLAHVVDGLREAVTEEMGPEAVDQGTRQIVGTDNELRQLFAAIHFGKQTTGFNRLTVHK